MTFIFPLMLVAQAAFMGTWSGPVTIHPQGGPVEHGTAVLWIGRAQDHLTGCIGETETHQTVLKNIRVGGSDLAFDFDFREGMPMTFHLRAREGHLVGSGGTGLTMDLDLQPAPKTHTLFEKVVELDDELFSAYNRRDLKKVGNMFATNLEFFHDKTGLTGYRENLASFQSLFKEATRYRRELDEASLEVYPVANYGAMEVGVHRFYAQPPGKPEQLVSTAKFVHVWKNQKGAWKITRVVSYDHH